MTSSGTVSACVQHAYRDQHLQSGTVIMINDKALVQTKSLLTTNQRTPAAWSATRAGKTEMAKADVAELQHAVRLRGGKATQAPGHERGPKAGRQTTLQERSGRTHRKATARDGLLLPCQREGFQARLHKVEAWQAQRGPKNPKKHGRRPQANHQGLYKDPRTGFGSVAQMLSRLRCGTPASPERGEGFWTAPGESAAEKAATASCLWSP